MKHRRTQNTTSKPNIKRLALNEISSIILLCCSRTAVYNTQVVERCATKRVSRRTPEYSSYVRYATVWWIYNVSCSQNSAPKPYYQAYSYTVRNKSKTILLQAYAALNRTLGAVHWMPVSDQAVDGPPYEGHANSNDKHNRPSTLTRRG